MLKKSGVVLVTIIIGVLSPLGPCEALRSRKKASAPNPQAKLALGEGEVKKLLLLMETDGDGKVSKQNFQR
jgi:hypothetical protein